MPRAENTSATSINSKNTSVSASSVHPTGLQASEEKSSLQNERAVDHLFTTTNRCKASLFINTGENRAIHVVHYAQREQDLYTQSTFSKTEDESYESKVMLFFIHGVGGTIQMWEPQIHYFLTLGYEIIALDLLGHGQSGKPRVYNAYQFTELASDVMFIFDRFSKRRNVLIGHSYGSSFCTMLSKERARKVCKTVLISGGGPTLLMPDRCSAFCLPLPFFVCIRKSVVKMFQRLAFHEETSDTVRQKISTFEISSFALKAIMQGQNWYESTEEYHASLILPVLLVYGKGDQFVTLGEEQWMQETIFGADLEVIEGAGHMVMLEKPTHVNDAIHRFLNRDSSTWSSHPAPEERPPGRGAAFQSPQLLENSEASVRSNGGRLSRLSRTSIRSKTMM